MELKIDRRNFMKFIGLGALAFVSGSSLEAIADHSCRRNQGTYSNSTHSQLYCKKLGNGRVVYYRVYTHAPRFYTEREETPPEPPPLPDYIIKAQKEMREKQKKEIRRKPTSYEKQIAKDLTEVYGEMLVNIFKYVVDK